MATLSLKAQPEISRSEYKERRQKALDFASYKPKGRALIQFQPKKHQPGRPTFHEVFGAFKPYKRTTGEDMLIIRAWMHKHGLPDIPEHFTIPEFASAMQWHTRPRHTWQHFYGGDVVAARRFINEWASALLPQIANDEGEAPAKFSSLAFQMMKVA